MEEGEGWEERERERGRGTNEQLSSLWSRRGCGINEWAESVHANQYFNQTCNIICSGYKYAVRQALPHEANSTRKFLLLSPVTPEL